MADRAKAAKGSRLDQFTKDVLYDSIVQVTSGVLRIAAIALAAVLVALIAFGWTVPAWTLVLVMLLGLGLMYVTRRVAGREANELRPKLATAEDRLDRHDSYGTNICSIMDNFQRVLAGDIRGVTVPEFIERGILSAGRDVMQENGHPADLRLSVLLAEDGHFTMPWAAGHNIQSQKKYRQPIDGTIAKIAFEQKVLQVWKDVWAEERGFRENPHATRKFSSMVSIPILIGDRAVGVFNVVTARTDAFDVADVNYLTSLGAVIQTAVGVAVKDATRGDERSASVGTAIAEPIPLPKRRILRRVDTKTAPESGVGSQGSPSRTEEASDD